MAETIADLITVFSVAIAFLSMVSALWRIWRYGPWWRNSLGRITFGTMVAIFFWLTVWLGLLAYAAVIGLPATASTVLRTLLSFGLAATGIGVNVALAWYRRKYLR